MQQHNGQHSSSFAVAVNSFYNGSDFFQIGNFYFWHAHFTIYNTFTKQKIDGKNNVSRRCYHGNCHHIDSAIIRLQLRMKTRLCNALTPPRPLSSYDDGEENAAPSSYEDERRFLRHHHMMISDAEGLRNSALKLLLPP